MSAVSAQSTPIEPARIPGFRRILHVLYRIGTAISGRLMRKSQAAGPSWREAAAAYARVALAIRRIVMLALEISKPGYGQAKGSEREGPERPERLEGLERPDWDDKPARPDPADAGDSGYDLTHEGMDGVVREICRDLGLPPLDTKHPWTELTVEQIARLVVDAVALLIEEEAARLRPGVDWRPESAPVRGAPGLAPRVHDG